MKIAVICDIERCSLIDIDQGFRGAYCLLKLQLINIYQITRYRIPKDSYIYINRLENPKSHFVPKVYMPALGYFVTSN
jgi:hypothetical protein